MFWELFLQGPHCGGGQAEGTCRVSILCPRWGSSQHHPNPKPQIRSHSPDRLAEKAERGQARGLESSPSVVPADRSQRPGPRTEGARGPGVVERQGGTGHRSGWRQGGSEVRRSWGWNPSTSWMHGLARDSISLSVKWGKMASFFNN